MPRLHRFTLPSRNAIAVSDDIHCHIIFGPGTIAPDFFRAIVETTQRRSDINRLLNNLDRDSAETLAALYSNASTLRQPPAPNLSHRHRPPSSEILEPLRRRQLSVYTLDAHYTQRLKNRQDGLYYSYSCGSNHPVDQAGHAMVTAFAHELLRQQRDPDYQAKARQHLPVNPERGSLQLTVQPHQIHTPNGRYQDLSGELVVASNQRVMTKGLERWRRLTEYTPACHVIYDYLCTILPELKAATATRSNGYRPERGGETPRYTLPLSLGTFIGLGLAGGNGLVMNKTVDLGPFTAEVLNAMATMADHIGQEQQLLRELEEAAKPRPKVPMPNPHWVQIKLLDSHGQPVEQQPWRIKTPDGAEHSGVTSVKGTAQVKGIAMDGQCEIRFPGASNILKDGTTPPPSSGGTAGSVTVQQGDTLTRIAQANGLSGADELYNHPANARFRKKRPNPNLIYPGDKIILPEPSDQPFTGRMDTVHAFSQAAASENLTIDLQAGDNLNLNGKRARLIVGSQTLEQTIDNEGRLSIDIADASHSTAELHLFLDDDSDQPTNQYTIELAHLDPVDTLSGIQARCNNLGFDCGVVDGIMGNQTRAGVRSFQAAHQLTLDGDPGPQTQEKLKQTYGC